MHLTRSFSCTQSGFSHTSFWSSYSPDRRGLPSKNHVFTKCPSWSLTQGSFLPKIASTVFFFQKGLSRKKMHVHLATAARTSPVVLKNKTDFRRQIIIQSQTGDNTSKLKALGNYTKVLFANIEIIFPFSNISFHTEFSIL